MEMDRGEAAGVEGRPPPLGEASSSAPRFGGSSLSRLGAAGGAESFDGALRVESPFVLIACFRAKSRRLRALSPEFRPCFRLGLGVQELKDLQSQLHQAADCCEKAFLDTEKKQLILEGTKSYICDAIVAVIDHLGTVSSKLERQLQEKSEITQTEQKINFLKQRLLACEQYAISLKLFTVRGDTDAVQYHRRYLSQSTERTKGENGANSSIYDTKGDKELLDITSSPVPGGTRTFKPYDVQSTMGIEPSLAAANFRSLAATRNSFSFRAEDVHSVLGDRKKKASHGGNIFSFLKRSKRHA